MVSRNKFNRCNVNISCLGKLSAIFTVNIITYFVCAFHTITEERKTYRWTFFTLFFHVLMPKKLMCIFVYRSSTYTSTFYGEGNWDIKNDVKMAKTLIWTFDLVYSFRFFFCFVFLLREALNFILNSGLLNSSVILEDCPKRRWINILNTMTLMSLLRGWVAYVFFDLRQSKIMNADFLGKLLLYPV